MIYLNNQEVKFTAFPNGERRLDLDTDLLKDVDNKVIWKYENDKDIFELLLFNKSMKQLHKQYKLYIGYFPYSRMDRVEKPNTAFSLEVITSIFEKELKYSATSCYILDPHSPKTLELLNFWVGEDFDDFAKELNFSLADHVLKDADLNNIWVVFPDKGAAQWFWKIPKRYHLSKDSWFPNR